MERLTERVENCPDPKEIYGVSVKGHDYVAAARRLAEYEDTGLMPDEIKSMQGEHFTGLEMAKLHSALMELKKYQEADRDGRLVVLPCQSGEHVFALLDDQKHVRECEIKHTVLDGWRKVFFIAPIGDPGNSYGAPFGAFGQTVFLTREEAEKALEAKQDGN